MKGVHVSVAQGTNLWIVGMPGSGKTTLGRMLAEGLGYRWLDLDAQIEQVSEGVLRRGSEISGYEGR
jgi:shikimate kinase